MKKTARHRALRYLILLVILLAIGLGVRQAFFRAEPPAPPTTADVRRGSLENTVLAAGELEAAQLVSVGAQASGQLQKLAVELGQRVRQGDLVAEIASMTQQNALRNAEAALKAIKARQAAEQAALKQATLEFQRQRQMLAQNASSRQAFETAEASYATRVAQIAALEAELAQAEISVDTARVNLGYTRITAPMEGTVVAVIAREGQTLNANQQAPTIIRLAQLDTLTVKAQISEADVIRVKPGMPVYFSILGDPDRRFHATLRSVEPAPESIANETSSSASSSASSSSSSAVYYNGLFDIANPDGLLRIGMTTQVSIVLEKADDTLLIPASAVQRAPAARGPRAAGAQGAGQAAGPAAAAGPSGAARGQGRPEGRPTPGADGAAPGTDREPGRGPQAGADGAARPSRDGARPPGQPATVRVLLPSGEIETRQIRIGIDNKVSVQVLEGLEAGDKVVIGSGRPATPAGGPSGGMRPPMRL